MIELRDTICVRTPPTRVWSWLCDLPDHYRDWHPAHVRCIYERGTTLEPGAVVVAEEVLHGRLHRLRLQVTGVAPNRLLQYSGRGFIGSFILEAVDGGTRFTATLSFGVDTPLIGRFVDRLLGRVFATRLAELQAHMREEARNLKRLLEADPRRA